ncbi:MAG: hypothetical protein BWY51_00046 [Parcubacteria group bacterium ADurb.Bin316]|nr:MAG: hypothetical protein BWY51_00046 [Parcubacteria group bacterium ADurb.Bin316]
MSKLQAQTSDKQFSCIGGCGDLVYSKGEKCASCQRAEATVTFLIKQGGGEIRDWESCPTYQRIEQPCENECSGCMRAWSIKETRRQVGAAIVNA